MKMLMMMMLIGLAATLTAAAAAAAGPDSCVGRCAEPFARGRQCSCDQGCLRFGDCCRDFRAVCTAARSCRGRCAEAFARGKPCHCDSQCVQFHTCCHDYQQHCGVSSDSSRFQTLRAKASGKKRKSQKRRKNSNSESEERLTGYIGLPASGSSGPAPFQQTNPHLQGFIHPPLSLLPESGSSPGSPDAPAFGPALPRHGTPSLGGDGPAGPSDAAGALNIHLVLSGGGAAPSTPGRGPGGLQDVFQALGLSAGEGVPEGARPLPDADLCSDSPINALTALGNGTILIFKGDLFWSVDPASRSISRQQNITEALGVPSPVDTVFTRCNCHGNTYVIKGNQYWRLDENMDLEPGFPKPLSSEFPGLMEGVSAALPVPATGGRPETVYFFRNGDTVQSFSFPAGSSPSCGKKAGTSPKSRVARQAGVLSGEIDIKLVLKGFPGPVTSALSLPRRQDPESYQHLVFSGPLFYWVLVTGDLPALAVPAPSSDPDPDPLPVLAPSDPADAPPPAGNSILVWLQCHQ